MAISREVIRMQLDRLLASRAFRRAGRSSAFLRYVVDRAVAGERGQLKEYVIGVDVFERGTDFDPRTDAIVRVEAGRLRSKLQSYYDRDGRNDPVIISIPKGCYAPQFVLREQAEACAGADAGSGSRVETLRFDRQRAMPRRRVAAVGAALAVVVSLVVMRLVVGGSWPADTRAGEGPSDPRIVVLPFDVHTESRDARRVADRLTERVTFELVRIGDLSVVPSTSAFRYRGADLSMQDLGRKLGVDLALQARLIDSDGPIIVEARLVDTVMHRKRWVDDSFAGDDVDDIARRIADAVNAEVLSAPAVAQVE